MKVLLAASEAAPIIKFGGLGDVVGSLPKALDKLKINADVVVPFYPNAKITGLNVYKSVELNVPFGNEEYVEVYNTKLPGSGVDIMLLKNLNFFNLPSSNVTEARVFAFFSRTVVELIKARFNTYDVIHCNDWHTGLITHLLEEEISGERPATLFTIHNLLYEGIGGLDLVRDAGITPGIHSLVEWDTEDSNINMMLQGITSSDFVSTVSKSYANEILTEEYGKNFAEILKSREGRLEGILNGIDYEQFPRPFDINSVHKVKQEYKDALKSRTGLEAANKPLFCFVSRLDPNQKGLELLLEAVTYIVEKGGQFVLLGKGDPVWEEKFKNLTQASEALKNNYACLIEFDEEKARNIYIASDFCVIPSKYEPCGLVQMISMWYGALPIVHGVGGLKDSVYHGGNGFVFAGYSVDEFKKSIDDGFAAYGSDKLTEMRINAVRSDFSWAKSAEKYRQLYDKVVMLRKTNV